MNAPMPMKKLLPKELKDYYWAYSDILRDIGINESTYDQRIMAFMAVKLLIDNNKLKFNFEYLNNFGLNDEQYESYKSENSKETFLNIIRDIENFGDNLHYFEQESKYNPDESTSILTYLNHFKTFELERYIQELPNKHLENVLDIYTFKANFTDYPKDGYKDLYESTISRMKKMSGDLTGQHFTQKSIIHLMCEVSTFDAKGYDKLAIYDPTCGTASMLMESAYYFHKKNSINNIELYGQELHGQTWLLAKIFLEISSLDGKTDGIKNTIAYGNTLTNPAFANAVLEQPNGMFTNTDISSHIWFLDSDRSETVKLIKADTKEKVLFAPHPQAKDKMKNSYSEKNIKDIKNYEYISKNLSSKNLNSINVSNTIGFKDEEENISFDELEQELNGLMFGLCEDFKNNSFLGIKSDIK